MNDLNELADRLDAQRGRIGRLAVHRCTEKLPDWARSILKAVNPVMYEAAIALRQIAEPVTDAEVAEIKKRVSSIKDELSNWNNIDPAQYVNHCETLLRLHQQDREKMEGLCYQNGDLLVKQQEAQARIAAEIDSQKQQGAEFTAKGNHRARQQCQHAVKILEALGEDDDAG